MDTEARKSLEELNETVHTKGWDHLSDDLETKIESLKEELTYPSVDQKLLNIAQGRIMAYRDILSLPKFLEAALSEPEPEEIDPV